MQTDNNKSGVFILGISDCGEKMCAAGGRISTQPGTALGIWEKSQDCEKNEKLIFKVTSSGHNSTVEHMMFHLAFNNVSVVVEQFMIEFRLASFTVKSRRYVDFSDAGYYVPELEGEIAAEYKELMDSLFADYAFLTENAVPKEDARFVLPYCFFSNFFCSLNGREMLHVLHSMLHGRGSRFEEIRALGAELFEKVKQVAPGLVTGFEERAAKKAALPDFLFLASDTMHEKRALCELLSFTAEPEKAVAKAALIANTALSSEQLEAAVNDGETLKKIFDEIFKTSRPRALENVSFTFRLNGVSLSTLTHFARHRMHSLQVPELTGVDRAQHIVPESVKGNAVLLQRYEAAFERNLTAYRHFISHGISEEKAVYLLLSGNTLDLVSTMNGRELLLFMHLRSCTRAQWEIQLYAVDMLRQLRLIAPLLFSFYGPSCFTDGKCPEGKFSCGKMIEMKEKFLTL